LRGGYDASIYAQAYAAGTWEPERGICPECGVSSRKRAQPLVMGWEAGSDVIADFTSAATAGVVITERVAAGLQGRFDGFELGPVEMVEDPKAPKRAKMARLPYQVPPLFELWPSAWVHADLERSSVSLRIDCLTCGVKRWHLNGTEELSSKWDRAQKRLVQCRVPRAKWQGALIPETSLMGIDMFGIYEFQGWICCTDRVREFVLGQGYTNTVFREIGETFTR
jgi:hypothetical protein